jgi:hypothetical protein
MLDDHARVDDGPSPQGDPLTVIGAGTRDRHRPFTAGGSSYGNRPDLADVRYVWGPEGSDVRRDEDRNGVIRRRDRGSGSGSGEFRADP